MGRSAGFPGGRSRVYVQGVSPTVDEGAFAAKSIVDQRVPVEVDLVSDGHDVVRGEVIVWDPFQAVPEGIAHSAQASVGKAASVISLKSLGNDVYAAKFVPDQIGRWHFAIRAWVDAFQTWRRGLIKKVEARQAVDVELLEGSALIAQAAERADVADRDELRQAAGALSNTERSVKERIALAVSPTLAEQCERYPDRSFSTLSGPYALVVDPKHAEFSAWYEMFPRSTGRAGEHGTFETAKQWLPGIAQLGFDTVYLPPIHPIGDTFRKGKNNNPKAAEGDVGSPWAIGAASGGHKSVHPELGGLEQFDSFVREATRAGLRVALDIALQVSPDHPYVEQHPNWFRQRPDGTIQYAENPPKKYQDIYPFDFETSDWENLWIELKSIFEFWIERGVRTFRVDNPHTKSLAFWHWCITELKAAHPDLVFLAEAFTRPKLMHLLAKAGFSQSYTYFTWRTTALELRRYLEELVQPPVSEFFRPNFWPNTPDILPEHLQHAARPAFALRLVLAATLSGNYGIYGPAFELMDNQPRPGAEEYVDNEKYELKNWPNFDLADGLRPLIRRVNQIRKDNPALQRVKGLTFHEADNELLLCYSKVSEDEENIVLVVVNMDVHNVQSGWVRIDRKALPQEGGRAVQLHDLLSDARYPSQGDHLYVRLDPQVAPAHVFRMRKYVRTEHDFDYFL